jgi:hypothetical protein
LSYIIGFGALFFLYYVALNVASKRSKKLKRIINIAFIIRGVFSLWNIYFRPLPDSGNAGMFELEAWMRAQSGFMNVIGNVSFSTQFLYSDIIAIIYSIIGRNQIVVQSINLLLGTLCIVLTYDLIADLWGKEISERMIWISAIMISPIIYSSVLLREVFVTFFLLLAIKSTVKWTKTKKMSHLIKVFVFAVLSAAFHAATIVVIMAVVLISFNEIFNDFVKGRVSRKKIAGVVLIFFAIVFAARLNLTFDKLHFLGNYSVIEIVQNRIFRPGDMRLIVRHDVYFSSMVYINHLSQSIFYIILRVFEFLIRPFIWDVRSIFDIVRIFENIILLISILGIVKYYPVISKNKSAKNVLLILILLTVVLALGSHEIIQGHRHKIKIIYLYLVLAAPFLSRFTLINRDRSKL